VNCRSKKIVILSRRRIAELEIKSWGCELMHITQLQFPLSITNPAQKPCTKPSPGFPFQSAATEMRLLIMQICIED
jgi:hypothetical protein